VSHRSNGYMVPIGCRSFRRFCGPLCWHILFVALITPSGCSRTTDPAAAEPDGNATVNASSAVGSQQRFNGGSPSLNSAADPANQRTVAAVSEPPSLAVQNSPAAPSGPVPTVPSRSPQEEQELAEVLFSDPNDPAAVAPAYDVAAVPSDRLQLRGGQSPEQLVRFLRSVDSEIQSVATGRKQLFDVKDANAELVRLSKLKLQAASELEEKAEPQTPPMAIAIRGKLQALSHLAALGDLPSAERLEAVARQHIDSADGSVALDSKLVLLGLAMERLRNGTAKDSGEILALVDRIASSPQTPDVSALMVLGQARAVLQQYGDDEASQKVRAAIVALFADHPNPNVSAMAIELAGSPKFAGVDAVLREIEQGQTITVDRWREAIDALVSDSPDMAAVQYLASAALQFEAFGQDELADATFDVLSQPTRFSGREAEEIAVAAQARRTRAEIIGQRVDLDLPSVDGRPLSLGNYSGRILLMPFWAIAFPDSLTVMQTLDQIREQSGGSVEIVGMNLDAEDAPADEFLRQSPVQFRSFQSVTPAGGGANQIARQFGVVSLPFVVIIDAEGKVAAVQMTAQGIAEQVQKLLPQ
jgi:hypothetical protein